MCSGQGAHPDLCLFPPELGEGGALGFVWAAAMLTDSSLDPACSSIHVPCVWPARRALRSHAGLCAHMKCQTVSRRGALLPRSPRGPGYREQWVPFSHSGTPSAAAWAAGTHVPLSGVFPRRSESERQTSGTARAEAQAQATLCRQARATAVKTGWDSGQGWPAPAVPWHHCWAVKAPQGVWPLE